MDMITELGRSKCLVQFGGAVIACLVAVVWTLMDRIGLVLSLVAFVIACVAGIVLGVMYALCSSGTVYKANLDLFNQPSALAKMFLKVQRMNRLEQKNANSAKRLKLSTVGPIDSALNDVMNLILNDFVVYWLKELVDDHNKLTELIKDDMWVVIGNMRDRLAKVDQARFVACDMATKVCQHYQRIRMASNIGGESKEQRTPFLLRSYLVSEADELQFLRQVSETLVILLFPKNYMQSMPVRHLVREIVACSVLQPTVQLICDPDFINRWLLNVIAHHQDVLEQHKKKYAYAATYEDFVQIINESHDVEHLRHMRFNIMTEIMQASTINNLKRAKGLNLEKELIPEGRAKGDMLQARNLKKYINQLTFAKTQCEKRIRLLGGPNYLSPSTEESPKSHFYVNKMEEDSSPQQVLPFKLIMRVPHTQNYFMKYLQTENVSSLLGFCLAVSEMERSDKSDVHKLGSSVFQSYIVSPASAVKLDKTVLKNMEAFLIGDKGPDAFYKAKEEISAHLEKRYYHSFVVSDIYARMIKAAEELTIDLVYPIALESGSCDSDVDLTDNIAEDDATCESVFERHVESDDVRASDVTDETADCVVYKEAELTRDKMVTAKDKLANKMHALKALKLSGKTDAKILSGLDREIEQLKQEIGEYEFYLETVAVWKANFHLWKVLVHSAEFVEDKDGKVYPLFLLLVQLADPDKPSGGSQSPQSGEGAEEGCGKQLSWVVSKRISQFVELKKKTVQIGSWVKSLELPRENKLRSKNYDKAQLQRTVYLLQDFLDQVFEDTEIRNSELLFTFLHSDSDSRTARGSNASAMNSPKKSKFFFSNLFKNAASLGSSGSSTSHGDNSDDDDFLFLDDVDGSRDDRIAEPLYALIGEIFDMRGVFKLLRRTLMTFVQITFDRTISKQLRESISYLFTEGMILYYIGSFRESLWPGGTLAAKPNQPRSDEEKFQTLCMAKEQFVNNIPNFLISLVGQQNARKGAMKVFESLQDVRLNKQLFYELLEMTLLELFPEIKTMHH